MQIFPFIHKLAFMLFSEIVIFAKQIGLRSPILLTLVWLQTEVDSTQSYYHYISQL